MSNGKGGRQRSPQITEAENVARWAALDWKNAEPKPSEWVPLPQMIVQAYESAQAERERMCRCGHQRWEHDTLGWAAVCDLFR